MSSLPECQKLKSQERILFVGDVHCKIQNCDVIDVLTDKIIHAARQNNCQIIVLGGDILHCHEKINAFCLNAVVKMVQSLLSLFEKVVLMVGNHDLVHHSLAGTKHHWMNVFKIFHHSNQSVESAAKSSTKSNHQNRVIVVDEPTLICDRAVAVPFYLPGHLIPSLQKWDPQWTEHVDVCFAHQELRGFKLGCVWSEHGDEWLPHFPVIVSGHLHVPQFNGKNAIYSGSAFQHSFGDVKPGVFVVVDLTMFDRLKNNAENNYQKSSRNILRVESPFISRNAGDRDDFLHLPDGIETVKTGMPELRNIHFRLNPHLSFSDNSSKLRNEIVKKFGGNKEDVPSMLRIVVTGHEGLINVFASQGFQRSVYELVQQLGISQLHWKFIEISETTSEGHFNLSKTGKQPPGASNLDEDDDEFFVASSDAQKRNFMRDEILKKMGDGKTNICGERRDDMFRHFSAEEMDFFSRVVDVFPRIVEN